MPIICIHDKGLNPQFIQKRLFEHHIAALYLSSGAYTGVPEDGAIRFAIFSEHSKEQIDRLLSVFSDFV